MTIRQYRTEAPFVVAAKNGDVKSYHYSSTAAIDAAKGVPNYRIIYGRHRGDWKELVHFHKGIRVCLPVR